MFVFPAKNSAQCTDVQSKLHSTNFGSKTTSKQTCYTSRVSRIYLSSVLFPNAVYMNLTKLNLIWSSCCRVTLHAKGSVSYRIHNNVYAYKHAETRRTTEIFKASRLPIFGVFSAVSSWTRLVWFGNHAETNLVGGLRICNFRSKTTSAACNS